MVANDSLGPAQFRIKKVQERMCDVDHEHGFGLAEKLLVRMRNAHPVPQCVQRVNDFAERAEHLRDLFRASTGRVQLRMLVAERAEDLVDVRICSQRNRLVGAGGF